MTKMMKKTHVTRKKSLLRRYDFCPRLVFLLSADRFQDDGAKPKQEAAECKQS
jgi:hypothetical protein